MFSPEDFVAALSIVGQWSVVAALAAGVSLGIVAVALPGSTTATAMAVILPVSFFMDVQTGLAFLVGLYKGGIYGGSIPAILIATPGTGAAVATILDGPELVRAGKGRKALDMALYSSVAGDTASDLVTVMLIVPISILVLLAGPADLAAVLLAAIVIAVLAGSGSLLRNGIMALLGLLLATVGHDPIGYTPRLTFGIDILENGIPLLPMLVGLFAVPEIVRLLSGNRVDDTAGLASKRAGPALAWREFWNVRKTLARSAALGTVLGMIPGVGQPVAALLGYNVARRLSVEPGQFGRGSLEGIAAGEAANNAVNGPTLVPLLTLGIPGDKITAVMLGAFVAHGLRPGPQLIEQEGAVILALLLAMILANAVLLLLGKILLPVVSRLVAMPREYLAPLVLVVAATGAFLYRSESSDLYFMAAFGLAGIYFKRFDFDVSPMILAFILCEGLEYATGQTLNLARGREFDYLFRSNPGAFVVLALCLAVIAVVIYRKISALRNDDSCS
ncbi:MAG: hypothetical protein DWQ08_11755 [Proteobacteria bacterium]|nr:MAG: hypothetical protein DWQ08_11755 [Pseudomonadota bacterium]